eukprot:s423_g8.t1
MLPGMNMVEAVPEPCSFQGVGNRWTPCRHVEDLRSLLLGMQQSFLLLEVAPGITGVVFRENLQDTNFVIICLGGFRQFSLPKNPLKGRWRPDL